MSVDPQATYYDAGGIESFEVIKAKLTREQYIGFHLGTAMNYLMRCNFKHELPSEQCRDIEKAMFHCQWFIDELQAYDDMEVD